MNKTINNYINQLHLDPKREAAVRKLVESVEETPQVDKLIEALTIKSKYEFVDLGLPSGIKWATCNIGANSPEEAGLYFAWGETEGYTAEDVTGGKKAFNWDNYKFYNESSVIKYNNNVSIGNVDNLNTLELQDDAAYQSDKTCRMPTQDDFEELLNNTIQSREVVNNINGWKLTSKTNNKSIFIPGAGYYIDGKIYEYNGRVSLWSSSLNESNPRQGWNLDGATRDIYMYYFDRAGGMSIRPVQDPNATSEPNLFNPADYVTKTELEQTIIKDGDGTKFLADNGKYNPIPRQFDVTHPTATISNISNYQGLSIVYGGGTLGLSTALEALIIQNPTKHYRFSVAVMNTSEQSVTVIIDTTKFKIADPANNTITVPAGGSVIIECYSGDGYVFVKW